MSYEALSRKWRPKTFAEIVGQGHVTRALANAISLGKIHHAYLFAGTRGVGKTTFARILARALNCEKGPTPDPCLTCPACIEILAGSAVDVQEIDGASNTGIDDVRRLRENAAYAPARFRYKIYIIDEVHMLSKAAFNGLLKILEEPPAHVVFVFATTEPNRIPDTILSRVQRFDFRMLTDEEIYRRLREMAEAERIGFEEEALRLVARYAFGSMRDGQSIVEQAAVSGNGTISASLVEEMLGLVGAEAAIDLVWAATAEGLRGDAEIRLPSVPGCGPQVPVFVAVDVCATPPSGSSPRRTTCSFAIPLFPGEDEGTLLRRPARSGCFSWTSPSGRKRTSSERSSPVSGSSCCSCALSTLPTAGRGGLGGRSGRTASWHPERWRRPFRRPRGRPERPHRSARRTSPRGRRMWEEIRRTLEAKKKPLLVALLHQMRGRFEGDEIVIACPHQMQLDRLREEDKWPVLVRPWKRWWDGVPIRLLAETEKKSPPGDGSGEEGATQKKALADPCSLRSCGSSRVQRSWRSGPPPGGRPPRRGHRGGNPGGGRGGGGGMKDMQGILRQAKRCRSVSPVPGGTRGKNVEASAGGGMVTVVVNGRQEVVSVRIEKEVASPDEVELLQDLVGGGERGDLPFAQDDDRGDGEDHGRTEPAGAVLTDVVPEAPRLISLLAKLPGVGEKTATRLALHMLKMPAESVRELGAAIAGIPEAVIRCSGCFNIADQDPCTSAQTRRAATICCASWRAPRILYPSKRAGNTGGDITFWGGRFPRSTG